MSYNNDTSWISTTSNSKFTSSSSLNYYYNYHSCFEKEIRNLEKEREIIKNQFACNLKELDDLPEPESIKKEEPQTIFHFDPDKIFDK